MKDKSIRTKMRPKEGTNIDLQREISQNGLQVVYCRFSAGVLQVVFRLFAGYLQSGSHILNYPVIKVVSTQFLWFEKTRSRWTDGYTDPHIDIVDATNKNLSFASINRLRKLVHQGIQNY